MAGQAGSQLLPAHILEQRTGIPDITKIDPKVDTPELRAAGKFYTTGWNGFDAGGGPLRRPVQDREFGTRNDTTVLVRNERWWANPGGPAKITITAVTDSQANVQKLLNKEAQVIGPQAESAIAEQIRAQGGEFNVFARGGQTYEHIDFQMTNPLFANNPELRKAVAGLREPAGPGGQADQVGGPGRGAARQLHLPAQRGRLRGPLRRRRQRRRGGGQGAARGRRLGARRGRRLRQERPAGQLPDRLQAGGPAQPDRRS